MVELIDNTAPLRRKPAVAASSEKPSASAAPRLKPTVNIPGYTVISKLGEGATAVVWLAQQESLDRPVALKVLRQQHSDNPKEVADFINEAKSVAKLKSRNIIQVYDIGQHEGTLYFAMEYVDGQTLFRVLQSSGPIEQRRALTIAAAVAQALDEAWTSQKIFHRDIKPENIMLESDGGVKLADLGLAGIIDAQGKSSVRKDELAGTPNYMSPEQVSGDGALDFHTDMYSLGATLYHMVTGCMPFDGQSNEAVLAAQGSRQLPNPRDINPNVTPGCAQMITRLMAKEAKHRFRSWSTTATELGKLAAGKLVVTKLAPSAESTVAKPGTLMPAPAQAQRKKPVVASKKRLTELKKKYSPQRAPVWLRVPCELIMLAWFGWLGYQLLWLPTRPDAVTPPTIPVAPPSEVAPTPRPRPTRPVPPRTVAPTPATLPDLAEAPAPAPNPTPTPADNEAALSQLKMDVVQSLLSSGLPAAQAVLSGPGAGSAGTETIAALLASKKMRPEAIADALEKTIGARTTIVSGGRRRQMEVLSVEGLTISANLFIGGGSSTVKRPSTFKVTQLDPAEQSRWLGAPTTPDVALAKFVLSMAAGDFVNARSVADHCGALAEACVTEVDARIRMLVE
jgi:serine/threonine protein kinase